MKKKLTQRAKPRVCQLQTKQNSTETCKHKQIFTSTITLARTRYNEFQILHDVSDYRGI